MDTPPPPQNRYHRQSLLPGIGGVGQQRLASARVLLVGCGALGTVIADQLVRAGVGHLRLADRDVVEWTNLQRQVLFDEEDARRQTPKAVAAAERLRRVNSEASIDPRIVDVHAGNVEDLLSMAGGTCDLILDGTDNAETRYLVNDVSIKHSIPWVYGACVGTEGRVMAVRPRQSPCLRCIFPEPPGAGELATCDTAGVLGPAAAVVASLQSTAAIKLLIGNESAVRDELVSFDVWENRFRTVNIGEARRGDCPCCGLRRFDFLDAPGGGTTTSLCGRNAVQIRGKPGQRIDLSQLGSRLEKAGRVERTAYLMRCRLHETTGIELTIFPDGRTIVQGTDDAMRARSLVSRYVGI